MIDMIEFLSDDFLKNGQRNIMKELTDNTIIICDSSEIKNFVSRNLYDTCVKQTEDLVRFHWTNCKDNITCELLMDFPQTSIFEFSDGDFTQKVIITVENAFVFHVKNLYDLWFAASRDNKISFTALTQYQSYEKYNNSPIMLYKALSVGRFSINGEYKR